MFLSKNKNKNIVIHKTSKYHDYYKFSTLPNIYTKPTFAPKQKGK